MNARTSHKVRECQYHDTWPIAANGETLRRFATPCSSCSSSRSPSLSSTPAHLLQLWHDAPFGHQLRAVKSPLANSEEQSHCTSPRSPNSNSLSPFSSPHDPPYRSRELGMILLSPTHLPISVFESRWSERLAERPHSTCSPLMDLSSRWLSSK